MSPTKITLSDDSLEALHQGFDGAVVSESSKRPNPEDPETSHVMKVRGVIYDISSRAYGIIYKAASGRHELVGGKRKLKDGKLERPQRAMRREVREEFGIGGKQILAIIRLAVLDETREQLGELKIETVSYLVVVDDPKLKPPKLSERELASRVETRWLAPMKALAAVAGQEHDSYTAAYDQIVNTHTLSLANVAIAGGAVARSRTKKPNRKKKQTP